MTHSLRFSILAVALGSISAGVTAVLLVGEGDSRPVAETASPLAPGLDLTARLERLEDENEALRRQLLSLDERPRTEPRVPALKYATREELDALREQLVAMIEGMGPGGVTLARPGTEAPPELEVKVAEALEAIRRDERYQKALASHEKSTASLEQRVTTWSNWLDLDEQQQTLLSDAMNRRDQMELEGLQAWESGADKETLEEMSRTRRQEFRRSVRGILSPEQTERFSGKFGDGTND